MGIEEQHQVGPILSEIVDQVIVLSLRRSHERRAYIKSLFREHKICSWRFFDALGPDSAIVEDYYNNGKVKAYPDCFRCGKLFCKSSDCNNLLIPPQVANFISYIQLWKEVSSQNIVTLVVEDDVVFHEHAALCLSFLKRKIDTDDFKLAQDIPLLLRLGWAESEEHKPAEVTPEIRDEVRMSNPCHILTSSFASQLLARIGDEIQHTSDVFLHSVAPNEGEAFSLFPPLASEASWSTGEFASLIHPKSHHLNQLEKAGDSDRINAYRKELEVGNQRKHTKLGKLFLQPSGWEKSHFLQRPVKQDETPLPWFTYGAIEFLHGAVRPSDTVFEFGAGYSTLWWQEHAEKVVSVEHDPDWASEIQHQLSDNAEIYVQTADQSVLGNLDGITRNYFTSDPRDIFPYDQDRIDRRGLNDRDFQKYATTIALTNTKFDIIVIDGMARRLCAHIAPSFLNEGGLIVFDNSNRSDYSEAYSILGDYGFSNIPFWGLVPGADFMTCTSVFTKSLDRFQKGAFLGSTFGFPEY